MIQNKLYAGYCPKCDNHWQAWLTVPRGSGFRFVQVLAPAIECSCGNPVALSFTHPSIPGESKLSSFKNFTGAKVPRSIQQRAKQFLKARQ